MDTWPRWVDRDFIRPRDRGLFRPWRSLCVTGLCVSPSAPLFVGAWSRSVRPPSSAAPTVDGREWRELFETTGLSWSQVASVCPTDGETPCSGTVGGSNLTGWTWATADQVLDLMDDHAPGLATADPPVVSGIEGFWGGDQLPRGDAVDDVHSSTYSYSEWTGGWTASTDAETGLPISAGAGYSHQLAGLHCHREHRSRHRCRCGQLGSWRVPLAPRGRRLHGPVVTPTVTGTLGNNGWYRSDVSVSWSVTDNESAITSTRGL